MKRRKILAVGLACLFALCSISALPAQAEKEPGERFGDLYYIDYLDHMTISGCRADVTDVVIPTKVAGLSVAEIGESAFSACKSLRSINLPNTITEINHYAFRGCTSLAVITGGNNVGYMGGHVFDDTPWLKTIRDNHTFGIIGATLVDGAALEQKTVTIPSNVKMIASDAIYRNDCIEHIIVPKNVNQIADGAFGVVSNLQAVTILNPKCSFPTYLRAGIASNVAVLENDRIRQYYGIMVGYAGSTTESYCQSEGIAFYQIGDCNNDQNINNADAISAMHCYANVLLGEPTAQSKLTSYIADVDHDGQITLVDVTMILRYSANEILGETVSWDSLRTSS